VNQQVEIIRKTGKEKPYDALIGLSGGRDSSYLSYLLTHKHNLRLLGAYYRTPFTPEITDTNVRCLAHSLGIPLIEIPISQKFHIKVARVFFLRWYKDPRPIYASLSCAVCKLLNQHVFRIAKEHNIRSIVFAGNPFERVQFLVQDTRKTMDRHSFSSQFERMVNIFRVGLINAFRCPLSVFPIAVQASLFFINPHTPFLRIRYPNIQSIEYFHYAPWVEADCNDTIKNHVGWQSRSKSVDTWKADCDFADLKNYMFLKMYGATYNDALYSNLIRSEQITRDQAISRIRAGAGLSGDRIRNTMETLSLPKELIDWNIIEKAREL
jgi:tRNA(Ile)-lysidine synthase TilS/MesJ